MKRALPLLALAVGLCWLVDGTDAALDLDVDLAERMACALRALLRGFCLPSTLTCTIAPACSGLRIATASALFALALPSAQRSGGESRLVVGPVARHICRAAIGVIAGLWLNLARLLAIELGMRASPAIGHTLHAFALPLLIAPLAAALLALLPRLKLPQRALLATTSALLLALLMMSRQMTVDSRQDADATDWLMDHMRETFTAQTGLPPQAPALSTVHCRLSTLAQQATERSTASHVH
ncbi:MAG: hypothetical protein ACI4RT_05365 [Candidatus Spyradenecus sp.]